MHFSPKEVEERKKNFKLWYLKKIIQIIFPLSQATVQESV